MNKQNQILLIVGALILAVILLGPSLGFFSVQEVNKLPSKASGHSNGAIQVPMFSTQCSQSGYDFCYEDSYRYGSARADAKVYWSFLDDNGRFWDNGHNQFAVGSLYYQAGFTGDKIYHFRDSNPVTSWDNVNCNENGCSGLLPVSTSKIKIASLGQEFTECIGFVAWDRDDNNGDWAWTWEGTGWVGSGNCVSIKVVECYDDSDCSGGEICDKTGSWQSWSCGEKGKDKTYFINFVFLDEDKKEIESINSNEELQMWFNLVLGVEGSWKGNLYDKEIKIYINDVFYDTFITDKNHGWVHTEFIAGDELTNGENEIKIIYEGDNQYESTQKIKVIEMIEECNNLYWFDDGSTECGYKEFCGEFIYQGLNTFGTLSNCEEEINIEEEEEEEIEVEVIIGEVITQIKEEIFGSTTDFFQDNKMIIFIIAGFLVLLVVAGGKK